VAVGSPGVSVGPGVGVPLGAAVGACGPRGRALGEPLWSRGASHVRYLDGPGWEWQLEPPWGWPWARRSARQLGSASAAPVSKASRAVGGGMRALTAEGAAVGPAVGHDVGVWTLWGRLESPARGKRAGASSACGHTAVGSSVGAAVGLDVGSSVGAGVGAAEGDALGVAVGSSVGLGVG
jgi:hypothetical protein